MTQFGAERVGKRVIYVGIFFDNETTATLWNVCAVNKSEFEKCKGDTENAHVTLRHANDLVDGNKLTKDAFKSLVETKLTGLPLCQSVDVIGFARDDKCFALVVQLAPELQGLVPAKTLHITMGLNGDTSPVYSNDLLNDPTKITKLSVPVTVQGTLGCFPKCSFMTRVPAAQATQTPINP